VTATVGGAIRAAAKALAGAGVPEPLGDARRLMAHAIGVPPDRLLLHEGDRLSDLGAELFGFHVQERLARRPVSHIIGSRLFWGRDFHVTPDVLDPRPETETLVVEALAGPFSRVLDLGTGSGCILVTLLAERPVARGLGTDLSPVALRVARLNAARHGVEPRAEFRLSDWWAAVGERFDLIVSNPPYIAASEVAGLAPEVRDHEPRIALTDEADGLSAFRTILRGASAQLAPGGRVLVEVGATQAEAVLAIGRAAGWRLADTRPDLDGRPRVCLFGDPRDPI
jgi:release factor glutamine methyltransferase